MKKSYKGLVIWTVVITVLCTGVCFIPVGDREDLIIRILLNVCNLSLMALFGLIYLSGAVYWISGISFEDAVNAGAARRKALTIQYIIRFGLLTVVYFILSVVAQLLTLNYWIDIGIYTVGTVALAVSMINLKL